MICANRDNHHVGQLCPVCGQDERHLGGAINPEWKGYSIPEFVARWNIVAECLFFTRDDGKCFRLYRMRPFGAEVKVEVPVPWKCHTAEDVVEYLATSEESRDWNCLMEFLGPLAGSEFAEEVRYNEHVTN